MKKRLCLLITCVTATAFIFSGCADNTPKTENSKQEENVVYTSEDGLPPLEDSLKQIYADAQAVYSNLSLGTFDTDLAQKLIKGDYTYVRVMDFDTYDVFHEYLSNYFTKAFIEKNILNPENIKFTQDENGALYTLDAARGANIFYAGHVFHDAVKEENQITLRVTAYYSNTNEAYDGERFFTAPENPDDYTTQDYIFTMLQEDGQWKFNDFTIFY